MTHKSIDSSKVGDKFSSERMSTYLAASNGNLEAALILYRWNIELSAALFELIAIVEVVVRNEFDYALSNWVRASGRDWMDVLPLDEKGWQDIEKSRNRSERIPSHGKMIAELNFGFWRFLATKKYLHSVWIPAMSSAFPNFEGSIEVKREQIEFHLVRIWQLRNRIGHHEPIFKRDVSVDLAAIFQLLDWISADCGMWAREFTRVTEVLALRPRQLLG
jgi:hypothetical protein